MARHVFRFLSRYALLLALIGLLSVFLLYPIALTVQGGFLRDPGSGGGVTFDLLREAVVDPRGAAETVRERFTLDHLRLVLKDGTTIEGFVNAMQIAALTTLLSLLIAVPLAVCSAKYRYPGKGVWNALILVPLILPPFVGAIGFRAIMGRMGALNSLLGTEYDFLGEGRLWGVVLVEALHLYPIIYLNAVAALANVDPALEEAAENLGAGSWRRFRRVTLPLVRPGIFAGATIVFIWSLTELGTPLMFDFTDVTPVQIFNGLQEVETSGKPYALTFFLLLAAVGLYLAGRTVLGRGAHAMYSKASRASEVKRLAAPAGLMVAGFFGLVTFLAVLPHVGVVLTAVSEPGSWYRSVLPRSMTGSHFETALTDPDSFGSIVNSLQYSMMAVVLNVVLGILVAYVVVRTRVWGRGLLDALCMLPLAVPGLVLAFGYVAVTLRWPFAGGVDGKGLLGTYVSVFGAEPNPVPLLVIAYAVRRLPYIVRSTAAGLEQTSGELEEAAINLGASRVCAVRTVIVPLIMANLIAGSLLVFSFSMLEVSDSLILAQQSRHFPITRAIWAFSNRLGDGPYIASAMGVWAMALLTVTLVGASLLMGKKLGSIFRV